MTHPVRITVSPGELIDRLTILQIKAERLDEPERRDRVCRELDALLAEKRNLLPRSSRIEPRAAELAAQLAETNRRLWEVEDELRRHEARGDFGARFVELARSVYHENDRRAMLKRRIDQLLGAEPGEEKVYH